MKQRTLDEIISYFDQQVLKMDIKHEDKIKLLGMITAIGYKVQKHEWIPCSERLPEESGRYLVSVLDGVGRRTTVAPYQPRYKAWTMTGRMAYWKVIAWMPLPEPYRAERRTDEKKDI